MGAEEKTGATNGADKEGEEPTAVAARVGSVAGKTGGVADKANDVADKASDAIGGSGGVADGADVTDGRSIVANDVTAAAVTVATAESSEPAAESIGEQIDRFFDEPHRIEMAYTDYARRVGISSSVMSVLDYLKDHDGASQREVCEYTMLPRQTVNNIVASFVERGYVKLGESEKDRRIRAVRFTESGWRYCNGLIAPSRAAEYRAMSELPERSRAALLEAMEIYGRVFRERMRAIRV